MNISRPGGPSSPRGSRIRSCSMRRSSTSRTTRRGLRRRARPRFVTRSRSAPRPASKRDAKARGTRASRRCAMCSRSRGFFERGKTEIKGPLYQEGAGRAKQGPGECEKTSPPPDRLRRSSPPPLRRGGLFCLRGGLRAICAAVLGGDAGIVLAGEESVHRELDLAEDLAGRFGVGAADVFARL